MCKKNVQIENVQKKCANQIWTKKCAKSKKMDIPIGILVPIRIIGENTELDNFTICVNGCWHYRMRTVWDEDSEDDYPDIPGIDYVDD